MITVIRRRDAEAEQLNLQLLQAGKMASIGELSAGVAHEINNPLAIIMTERQLMLDAETAAPLPDKEFRKQFGASMDQIGVQIERCKRITQNLLRFSRRTRSVIERVDLNAFLEEVVELMEREAATEGIAFAADLEEGPLEILSDPSQLQQVFLNLITNAVDALRVQPYGTITVKTRRDAGGGGVRVVIADTGPGIAPENLERIFDPFFTTKPVGQGTGLGLAICYGTVRRLGGTITVRSEPGRGAEFTVFLPDKPPGGIPEQADPFRRQSNRFAGLEAL
jgi:two-component system NtrC family sensor kinase